MSKTLYIEFHAQGSWAFDVVTGIFLKHLIDAAELRLAERQEAWLEEAITHWRFNAICGDNGLFLDENWTSDQIRETRELIASACALLTKRSDVSAAEMSSWRILDGQGVFPRGLDRVSTRAAIQLGMAIGQVLDHSLPQPPRDSWWFFGVEDTPQTWAKPPGAV